MHAAGVTVVVAYVADEKGKASEQELGVRYITGRAMGAKRTASYTSRMRSNTV
jgi:hypothetical protein